MLAAALICPRLGEDFRPLLENRLLTAGELRIRLAGRRLPAGRASALGYLRDLESYVTPCTGNGGPPHQGHRVAPHHFLAVQAQGGDPTAFGRDREGKPIDLEAEGTHNWSRPRS